MKGVSMARDAQACEQLRQDWLAHVQEDYLQEELGAMGSDPQAVTDAFFQDLVFGTAGLRGILGAGNNRMNVHTVGRATQGFADYLNANFQNPSIAIGRDSRNRGDELVRRAASVLAANGVKAYVYPEIVPTPAVSFAVRHLGCSGGINMTASHNPAAYNGYKAYGPDGCQIVTEAADAISAAIAEVDLFDGVRICDFDEAVASGDIQWIDDEVLERFVDAVEGCSAATEADSQVPLRLVYTPLNGAGLDCVKRILDRVGITDVAVVQQQASPDGDFPTCPYPNPEIREALELAIQLAEEVHPDLLLATDPDADRVGIGVKNGDDYQLLSGNEVGVLLLDYLAGQAAARGDDLGRRVAVTTIVSSSMVDALAAQYGFTVKRTLTGFKYIGELIAELEAAGEEDRFLFGFEESYGYLNGTHVRDKDAIDATMLICQMAQHYKARGLNLAEAMEALYGKHGYYSNRTLSFAYPGAQGSQRMAQLMAGLRTQPPTAIVGLEVLETVDYAEGVDGLPSADVVEFRLQGGNKVIVRPSGTEPKVKAYLFAQRPTRAEAEDLLDDMAGAMSALMA